MGQLDCVALWLGHVLRLIADAVTARSRQNTKNSSTARLSYSRAKNRLLYFFNAGQLTRLKLSINLTGHGQMMVVWLSE